MDESSYISRFIDWIEGSIKANPQEWAIGVALVAAVIFGMWLHKKLTKKPEKH